jgi:GNAT superfamily N-acetyltransferase
MKQIELADNRDINLIMQLITAAIQEMNTNGIDQWDNIYPDREQIQSDITAKTLYKCISGDQILGIIVLNRIASPEYNLINWDDSGANFLVVHRLTVHPKFQGKGIAKELMNFAESFAGINNLRSIRLDAFTKNPFAIKLYEKLHFNSKGIVKFRKGNFCCFEKVLDHCLIEKKERKENNYIDLKKVIFTEKK